MASPPPGHFSEDPEPGDKRNSSLTLAIYALITFALLALAFYFAGQAARPASPSKPASKTQPASLYPPAHPIESSSPGGIGSSIEPAYPDALDLRSAGSPVAGTESVQGALSQVTGTPTSHPTFTPRPSETPTITPTATATPTRTLIPSLTPAFPFSDNSMYQLADWTPELASRLIALMEAYPETLSTYARGEDNAGYYAAFQYADLALKEALLRFPSTPAAEDWLWHYTYNLARLGDPRAGVFYAGVLASELNSKTVTLKSLYDWGLEQDPQVAIETIPLEGSPGLLSNSLVKVSAGEHGSAFLWLQETPAGFQSYPLTSDFDFLHPTTVNYFVSDLTGDGTPEVAIFHSPRPGSYVYDFPHIFSLSGQLPVELPFAPSAPPPVGPDFTNQWEPAPAGAGDLEFIDTVFPPCPVTVEHLYRWNGRSFEFIKANYRVDPQPALLNYCSLVIDHSSQVWGIKTTIQLMESILPDWPPAMDLNGAPLPQDSLDEWRFRLAIYHALAGDQDQAKGYASSIVANPAVPGSSWVAPAQDFLEAYRTQRDIYRACLLASFCDPRLALQSLVSTLSAGEYTSALNVLKSSGVAIRSSGYFDFDADGVTERWMVLRHLPEEPVEFWILAQNETGVKALFVSTVGENLPQIAYLDPDQTPPIVVIGPDITFQLERKATSHEPFIVFVQPERKFSSDLTQKRLEEIQALLLSGGDPKQASQDLVDLKRSPIFTCSFTLCPRYYYLLGLSYELSGEKDQAVVAYLKLWRDYHDSPYATMARLKLSRYSATPTPTITPSPSSTPTPLQTFTPAPSGTLPAPTGTGIATGTPASYPYP